MIISSLYDLSICTTALRVLAVTSDESIFCLEFISSTGDDPSTGDTKMPTSTLKMNTFRLRLTLTISLYQPDIKQVSVLSIAMQMSSVWQSAPSSAENIRLVLVQQSTVTSVEG